MCGRRMVEVDGEGKEFATADRAKGVRGRKCEPEGGTSGTRCDGDGVEETSEAAPGRQWSVQRMTYGLYCGGMGRWRRDAAERSGGKGRVVVTRNAVQLDPGSRGIWR